VNLKEAGPLGIAQIIAQKHLLWSTERIKNKIEDINQDASLSRAEQAEQVKDILKEHKSFLGDLDRFVTRSGMVDMVAYASRLAEVCGDKTATAMALESLVEGILHMNHMFDLAVKVSKTAQTAKEQVIRYTARHGKHH